ncbi:hypothetical protein [Nonomuraea guangzhouensis]|uniref:YbaB/EbfC DNA-binding family protein n=1 Tax=Nonomuraea guangzhouensis TaxID=1291555 RepID=A0ABW4GD16_9ACTN|nr:hypothetical protein [Nonomuraea guangzhouensis]
MTRAFDEAAIDRMIAGTQRPLDGFDELYQQVLAVQGFAQDAEKLVTVECSAQGVTGLDINPRALRWGSDKLATTILELIARSLADLQEKSNALMAETWGEAPLDLTQHDNPADLRLRNAQDTYDRAMENAMAELARIQRRVDDA